MEILNKRSRADFTVGNIYFLLPIFRKARPSFIRVFQTMIRLCYAKTLQFEKKNSVQYDTLITREKLNKKKSNVKSI